MLKSLLYENLAGQDQDWLDHELQKICHPPSARNLYLTYSLIGRKIPGEPIEIPTKLDLGDFDFLRGSGINLSELARIYLLSSALRSDAAYFVPKVATLIQVSDTGELITLLRYLMILPHRDEFCETAVEALRTNIATVFEAISMDNSYPMRYFNEQQWNQMYLKAAFMQLDLMRIQGVEERANAPLARIISDYAHERWAASRHVDPHFWMPVSGFLDEVLLGDMDRLLASADLSEQKAGFLCCMQSGKPEAKTMIESHPLNEIYHKKPFGWKDLKNE